MSASKLTLHDMIPYQFYTFFTTELHMGTLDTEIVLHAVTKPHAMDWRAVTLRHAPEAIS